ncbi:hypothetical protein [Aquamicrobium terrae]|uniref:Uncharacterized protein n=1 Tax=Aquamicrobium terrae TaxID=1324945 RepID=A0ABV2N6E5_9HYPH
MYADAKDAGPSLPRPFPVRTRKNKQYQIINRFKKFESCLNRLDVGKVQGCWRDARAPGLVDAGCKGVRQHGAVECTRHILYLICPAQALLL